MSAPRLLVPAIGAPGETLALPAEEARHARSRRLAEGDEVVLLDGRGGRAFATLLARGAVRVTGPAPARGEPARRVDVLLAAADPARVEWAVEKGTECGAASFYLAVCARSQEAHVRALASRRGRLSRIAAEAVKQCDRTCVPEVLAPRPLGEVLASLAAPLFLASAGAAPLPAALPPSLAVAIGPEGGFTEEEERLFLARGTTPFGLGPRTLRMETATVAALSFLVERS